VLLDASGSMHRHLDEAKRAAAGLLRILRPFDVASVSAFSGRSRVLQEFTGDQGALRASLESIRAGGTTTLYDALYIAVAQSRQFVRRRPQAPRRQVVVVLSDGRDTTSLLPLEDVLERVRESGAVVYTIRLRPPVPFPSQDGSRGRDEYTLRRIAETTGGRAFFASGGTELREAYAQIARELTSQYVLAYTAEPGAERWRRIEVRVNREGSTIRTREGHFVQ
jgi:Ca-activated chloride channel family protein